MSQLLPKLCKNENSTDIPFYQTHEHILKYYRLTLFKEIVIGFNYDLQTTWESLASLFFGLLV